MTQPNHLPELAADTLAGLGMQINEHHEQAIRHAGKAIEHALACGELLIEAKSRVQHGQWLPWLRKNVGFSERTVQSYMRIARRLPRQIRNGVADLSVRGVLRDLATPRRHAFNDDLEEWLERNRAIRAKRPDDVSEWTIEDVRACVDNIRAFDTLMHRHGLCEGGEDLCTVCYEDGGPRPTAKPPSHDGGTMENRNEQ